MRVVALEEHFLVPSLVEAKFDPSTNPGFTAERRNTLGDLGETRLKDMDAHGITQQVISATLPGADLLDGTEGIEFAQATNDRLAQAVREHPTRFGGFAHLPMREPQAAAEELERAIRELGFSGAMVNGLTEHRFLDDPRFDPILKTAARLEVPIYIHPNIPPKPVYDIYYAGLPGLAGPLLGSGVFGWHSETAIHVFRLALSGTFERHPKLTIIVGHMGEMLPFILGRADDVLMERAGFTTPISKVITDRVYITTAGVFTVSPFLNALTTFGADRIMFSVDYPYHRNAQGRFLLDALPLSHADREKIAHGNADRVLKLRPAP
ncbi:MAG: amidohydrolase family protein [Gammaproteobacteria bacterium]|jgi:predicted TIM-barrel fold metal-dependent hydrolase|nr:amidohydrolase family protein [Gammaproteobacteria bacterium]